MFKLLCYQLNIAPIPHMCAWRRQYTDPSKIRKPSQMQPFPPSARRVKSHGGGVWILRDYSFPLRNHLSPDVLPFTLWLWISARLAG
ncbi:hypothetical protein TESG_08370 [Trichophyton tonsurans CBS 112818]|uniref:Uncharacterized protein n=1 Tax=Trichophyton tonsurans (strain CBS 112818) TaxID=647933 RepID=F2RUZ5_TRIT1|nr:hypothetical protein TESG_08370 [Trichophyton tonsurans CBS 112818]